MDLICTYSLIKDLNLTPSLKKIWIEIEGFVRPQNFVCYERLFSKGSLKEG